MRLVARVQKNRRNQPGGDGREDVMTVGFALFITVSADAVSGSAAQLWRANKLFKRFQPNRSV
jgi:hypothetical protein